MYAISIFFFQRSHCILGVIIFKLPSIYEMFYISNQIVNNISDVPSCIILENQWHIVLDY